jgi:thiamine-phosphate pyrophosphorylase
MRKILYAISDRRRFGHDHSALLTRISWLARAGVDLIQIRERDLPDAALVALARGAVAAAAGTPARVLVNDRADIAVAAGAHGVHLRGDSLAADRVRAWVPRSFLVGRSVHAIDEACSVERAGGCDFLLFGTVFASRGKGPAHPTAGVDGVRSVCASVTLPVVAIGGIDTRRVAAVAAAGASGIAAVDLFFDIADEREARARVESARRAFDSGSRVI